MSGNQIGYIKARMGLKGKTTPGQMISRMNEMKAGSGSGVGRIQKASKIKNTIKKII